jgi:hypothetical protein
LGTDRPEYESFCNGRNFHENAGPKSREAEIIPCHHNVGLHLSDFVAVIVHKYGVYFRSEYSVWLTDKA